MDNLLEELVAVAVMVVVAAVMAVTVDSHPRLSEIFMNLNFRFY